MKSKNIHKMKKYLKIRHLSLVLVVLGTLSAAWSCEKDKEEDPPELPPVESMLMDFSAFSEQPAGAKGTEATYANFLYSYATVGFWSLSATLVSALPVAAYGHALQQSPVYLGDQTWEWSFDFMLNNVQYSAILTSERLSNEEFSMDMSIGLAAAPATAVKWFDGVVRYDHTHATWTIYKDGTQPVLEIEWNKDFETEKADLTYTFVEQDHAQQGSYIMWDYNPGAGFDGAYNISLAEGMTTIEWNTETIKGRVMSMVQFQDEEWHCWDSKANGLADITCE